MADIQLPPGATLIGPSSGDRVAQSSPASGSIRLPEGATLIGRNGAAAPEPTVSQTNNLGPSLGLDWLREGVGRTVEAAKELPSAIMGLPQEFQRQAAAHKGQTLAQRALDPEGMRAALGLATTVGPQHLEMLGAPPIQTAARPAAVAARQAGYVLPPKAISEKPGIVSQVLAGWGGKIKTQQAASARNQEVTNQLAAKALGLPPDTVLSDRVFNQVRQEAGLSYQAISSAIPVVSADSIYDEAISSLGGANGQAAKIFPKITANPGIKDLVDELKSVRQMPTPAAVEVVKELRFNANANLHAIGDPSKHALGIAQRQAADAIDELVDRNLQAAGKPGLVDQYRKARQLIAKTYDVEGSTNPATGDVNALGLARLAAKGRPLTDELDTIADAANAFPKSMQAPAGFGYEENMSVLDFFGGLGAAASGHPEILAAVLGRPLARGAVLSRPIQALAAQVRPSNIVLPPALQRIAPAMYDADDRVRRAAEQLGGQ